jgi:hypothetical protein
LCASQGRIFDFWARKQPDSGDVARFAAKNQMVISELWSFFPGLGDSFLNSLWSVDAMSEVQSKSCAFA